MIELKLYCTEEEVSIIMQALSRYMYNNPQVTEEQWEIANRVIDRIDENYETLS